jgi:hypothetical protein
MIDWSFAAQLKVSSTLELRNVKAATPKMTLSVAAVASAAPVQHPQHGLGSHHPLGRVAGGSLGSLDVVSESEFSRQGSCQPCHSKAFRR